MSKPLTHYFKVKTKRRQLSLLRKSPSTSTPLTRRKNSPETANMSVIDLVSDDEELCQALDSFEKESNCSFNASAQSAKETIEEILNSSNSTIIYTPETPRKSQTPLSVSSKSPGSHNKFFSPVKRKNIKIRTPTKVKKNLCNLMAEQEDPVFVEACAGMDDKTIFLLTIINKYLNDKELRSLLSERSHDLLSNCMQIRKPGMRLVCRLYWRKEGWYRLDEIKKISSEKKDDIDDPTIQNMISNLIENYLLESANCAGSKHDIKMDDCLILLKSDELKAVCKDLKLKANNKMDATDCLRSYCRQKSNISSYFIGAKTDNESRVLKMLKSRIGPCFRLTEAMRQTLNELYILMYLGIDHNILSEKKLELTLIYDKIERECYPVDKDTPIDNASVVFKMRDDFERYLQAGNIFEEYLATINLEDKCRIIGNVYRSYKDIDKQTMLSYKELPPWLQRFTPPYLYVKILESSIQELKKMKSRENTQLAVDILTELISQNTFRQHKKAEWYAEKALILDKFMSSVEEAALILLEGFESNMSEVAKDHMRPRATKIAVRRTNGVSEELSQRLLTHATKDQIMEGKLNANHIYKLPFDSYKGKGKIKFETRTADGLVVQEAEEFCISHYIAQGKYTHGGHWEGRIVTTIFFLLFWDIIYARLRDVRGIYLTYYQVYPLDMFMDSFYENRKALIDDRLKEIEESPVEDLVARMLQTWECRRETELSGINRAIGWDNVCAVSLSLRPRALAAICRRLATDYRYSYSGFPDLTLWNVNTNEIKFVEVKTDSDKPSMKQIQWMYYLQENGIETEFCYVGVNTMRCKARNKIC